MKDFWLWVWKQADELAMARILRMEAENGSDWRHGLAGERALRGLDIYDKVATFAARRSV